MLEYGILFVVSAVMGIACYEMGFRRGESRGQSRGYWTGWCKAMEESTNDLVRLIDEARGL